MFRDPVEVHSEVEAREIWKAFCDIHRKAWSQERVQVSPTVWHLGVDRRREYTYFYEVTLDEQAAVQSAVLKYEPRQS